jgi:hypothetical protein
VKTVLTKVIGFLVVDACEDWKQPLTLEMTAAKVTVLDWPEHPKEAAALFPTRALARAAIHRTAAWRVLTGEPGQWPDPKGCVIRAVRGVVA